MSRTPNKPEDVWKFVDQRSATECWPWTSSQTKGYGHFRIQQKYYKAHRIVYLITHGSISLDAPISNYEQGFVLHKCDNSICCNPDHLYLGSIMENMADKVARNRQHRAAGELHAKAKLTNAQASSMRALFYDGIPRKDLAKFFGVNMCVVYKIIAGETYCGG